MVEGEPFGSLVDIRRHVPGGGGGVQVLSGGALGVGGTFVCSSNSLVGDGRGRSTAHDDGTVKRWGTFVMVGYTCVTIHTNVGQETTKADHGGDRQ